VGWEEKKKGRANKPTKWWAPLVHHAAPVSFISFPQTVSYREQHCLNSWNIG